MRGIQLRVFRGYDMGNRIVIKDFLTGALSIKRILRWHQKPSNSEDYPAVLTKKRVGGGAVEYSPCTSGPYSYADVSVLQKLTYPGCSPISVKVARHYAQRLFDISNIEGLGKSYVSYVLSHQAL
jgi:hypothetical protein